MAVNLSAQKQNLASALVNVSQTLTKAWGDIQRLNNEYVKAGLSYVAGDFDTAAGLVYVDPTQIPTLLSNLNAFVTWMNTAGNGDLMFKVSNFGS